MVLNGQCEIKRLDLQRLARSAVVPEILPRLLLAPWLFLFARRPWELVSERGQASCHVLLRVGKLAGSCVFGPVPCACTGHLRFCNLGRLSSVLRWVGGR